MRLCLGVAAVSFVGHIYGFHTGLISGPRLLNKIGSSLPETMPGVVSWVVLVGAAARAAIGRPLWPAADRHRHGRAFGGRRAALG